jgi:YVTN family beta-propeller protein
MRMRFVVFVVFVVLVGASAFVGEASAAGGWMAFVSSSTNPGSITPIDLSTGAKGTSVTVGAGAVGLAITPDGRTALVVNQGDGTVTPVDLATGTAGQVIGVGVNPFEIAITPNGKSAYVPNLGSGTVTPINVVAQTNGPAITVGAKPSAIAITPDGRAAYVVNNGDGTVTPINIATNTPGTPIPVGGIPVSIAVTPDGATAYVSVDTGPGCPQSVGEVIPIHTATNTTGAPITVGTAPSGIAITPDGSTAYVTNFCDGTVTPISVATDVAGTAIPAVAFPGFIAITPDGKRAWVTSTSAGLVVSIDLATSTVGSPVSVHSAYGIAITPDQAPSAAFSVSAAFAGSASSFDGSASSSPVGSIASYHWDFGDGQTRTSTTPLVTHVYATPGAFTARLTVTNSGGTSLAQVFTGQTVSNQGGPQATVTHAVTVSAAPPPTPTLSPTLSRLRVSPSKFVLAGRKVKGKCVKLTAKNVSGPRCQRAIKLNIAYVLSTPDIVTFVLTLQATGRTVGGGCVKPTNKSRRRPGCTRLLTVPGKLTMSGKAGTNQFTFTGKIGGHKLGPGTYQLTATPNQGASHAVKFAIVA